MSETLRMTPGEERDLRAAFDRDRWAGEWNSLPTAIDRLLESRALLAATATTPDNTGSAARLVANGHTWPCTLFYSAAHDAPHLYRRCTCAAPTPDEVGLVEYRVVGMDQEHGFNRSTGTFLDVDGFDARRACEEIRRARGGTIETRRVSETPWVPA